MRLYIVKIQLAKFSALGADGAGETMKYFSEESARLFCGDGARKFLLQVPTTTTHISKVPTSPTGRFMLRCTYLHAWSSLITQVIITELWLVAVFQNKITKQLK